MSERKLICNASDGAGDMAYGNLSKIPLSEKVLGIVIQGYKVGKVALALLLIGTILIRAAFSLAMANKGMLAIIFLVLGAVLVGFVAYKFYVEEILPVKHASERLQQNAELLDVVQEAALQLTGLITEINDFSLYHAKEIVFTIDNIKGVLAGIPFAQTILTAHYLAKPEQLVKKIREFAEASRGIVADIRDSVAQGQN
jgi:hypothetical protein